MKEGKKGEREGRNENGLKEVVEKRKEGSKRREEGRGKRREQRIKGWYM